MDFNKENSHLKNLFLLHDKLSQKFAKFDLEWNFRGGSSEDDINNKCIANLNLHSNNYNTEPNKQLILPHKMKLDPDILNNNRHYFVDKTKNEYKYINPNHKDDNKSKADVIENSLKSNLLNSSIIKFNSSNSLSFFDSSSGVKRNPLWVLKITSVIDKNKINIYKVLSDYDFRGEGIICVDDLIQALFKLQINLNKEDVDNMLRYFHDSKNGRISIKEFSKNFVAYS